MLQFPAKIKSLGKHSTPNPKLNPKPWVLTPKGTCGLKLDPTSHGC